MKFETLFKAALTLAFAASMNACIAASETEPGDDAAEEDGASESVETSELGLSCVLGYDAWQSSCGRWNYVVESYCQKGHWAKIRFDNGSSTQCQYMAPGKQALFKTNCFMYQDHFKSISECKL